MKERRYSGAPTEIPSSDGIYDLGSIRSSSQDIPKYFLLGGEFEKEAKVLCNTVLSKIDPANRPHGSRFAGNRRLWYRRRARRKIAATIWHTPNEKLDIYTGVVKLGMTSTADPKEEAFGLCTNAVRHLGEACLGGSSGTGNGLHPTFQHESQKPGTVTFTDQDGNLAIVFDFSLYDP